MAKRIFHSILPIAFYLLICLVPTGFQSYPENYYIFPIDPGNRGYFAGSAYELRTAHFHAGLDIKTGGKEGLPVLASAKGFISRVKVSPGGYGNAVYIKHPNGQTTVYAHLQSFMPKVQKEIMQRQYKNGRFSVDLRFPSTRFPVKQGEQIGISGNSGGSVAPHLHFEIRDGAQTPLNPVYFKFKELVDNLPPTFRNILLKTMNADSRVEGKFGQEVYIVNGGNGKYSLSKPVHALGKIGTEIFSYDRAEDTYNKYGIIKTQVYDGEKLIFQSTLDKIPFNKNALVKPFQNFKRLLFSGQRYTKAYPFNGIYSNLILDSRYRNFINITEGEQKDILIKQYDSFGNVSELKFKMIGGNPPRIRLDKADTAGLYDIQGSILSVDLKTTNPEETLQLKTSSKTVSVQPAYRVDNTNVYLYDLDKGLPKTFEFEGKTYPFTFKEKIKKGQSNSVYAHGVTARFNARSLHESIYLTAERMGPNAFKIGEVWDPLYKSVHISAQVDVDPSDVKYAGVYHVGVDDYLSYLSNNVGRNSTSFRTPYLGKFEIKIDKVAPQLENYTATRDSIGAVFTDSLSGIEDVWAKLNGKFILMNYDAKVNKISTEPWDSRKPYSGNVTFYAKDQQGNLTQKTVAVQ